MTYTCKGTLTRTVVNGNGDDVDVEIDCGCEFVVTMSGYVPATYEDPAEGGECDPSECPACGTEVDAEEVEKELADDCDEPDDYDVRDAYGNSLDPQVAAQEFGGSNYP